MILQREKIEIKQSKVLLALSKSHFTDVSMCVYAYVNIIYLIWRKMKNDNKNNTFMI